MAFIFGSIEPDINLLSYLRREEGCRMFSGHNAENSHSHIIRLLCRLRSSRMDSLWSFFLLGTLMHYVADSFTAVHNSFLKTSLAEHLEYENSLHECLESHLKTTDEVTVPYSPLCMLEETHRDYCSTEPGIDTDARHIVSVCLSLFVSVLSHTPGRLTAPAQAGSACPHQTAL